MKHITTFTAAFIAFTSPTFAQEPPIVCNLTTIMHSNLTTDYGEKSVAVMIMRGGETIMELFANMKTGSWTLLVTDANDYSCVVQSGTGITIDADGLRGIKG